MKEYVPVVYLVLSHTGIEQLKKLVIRLIESDPESYVIVVHDDESVDRVRENLIAIDRLAVFRAPHSASWGGIEIVDNVIFGLEWINRNLCFDWVVLISGQDYPLMNPVDIKEYLLASPFDAYIEGYEDTNKSNPRSAEMIRSRYQYWYFKLPKFPYYFLLHSDLREKLRKLRLIISESTPLFRVRGGNRGTNIRFGIRRLSIFNDTMRHYSGMLWFNVNKKTVSYIIDFIVKNAAYRKYYKKTWIPDESFFQTILYNSQDLKIENNHKRFLNFQDEIDTSSPLLIKPEQLRAILNKGYFFGRKFDAEKNPVVIDKIDESILAKD